MTPFGNEGNDQIMRTDVGDGEERTGAARPSGTVSIEKEGLIYIILIVIPDISYN